MSLQKTSFLKLSGGFASDTCGSNRVNRKWILMESIYEFHMVNVVVASQSNVKPLQVSKRGGLGRGLVGLFSADSAGTKL